jgi:hypothetical protein
MPLRIPLLLMLGLLLLQPGLAKAQALEDDFAPRDRDGRKQVNTRQGLVLGFNLGIGWARPEIDGVSESWETGLAGNARLGYGISESWLVGLEFNAWGREDGGKRRSFTNTLLVASFYPKGGSFGFRAGFGGGQASLRVEAEETGQYRFIDDWGWGVLLGMGYEWRLGGPLALGATFDASYVDAGDVRISETETADIQANFTALTMSFTWYLY